MSADSLFEDGLGASILRIALDKDAARSYEKMAEALKTEGFVKLSPSRFLSFMTNFFFTNYFESDREILLSEFFDPKEYVTHELKKAKDGSEIGAALEQAMVKVKRMQELKGLGGHKKKPRKNPASDL